MIRMTLVLIMALMGVMLIAGRDAEVADNGASSRPLQPAADRSAEAGDGEILPLAPSTDQANAPASAAIAPGETVDDARAIELAIAATESADAPVAPSPRRVLITSRSVEPISDLSTTADEIADTDDAPGSQTDSAGSDDGLWFVTGSRVNLRAGPSTSDAVVGQAVLGQRAEVVQETADGWFQIRVRDSGQSGYIFGQFLSDQRPG